ncbi:two-component sensor histidine kinase [Fulvimarina endophytica]|uniref:histidine kinase n=1 Tax=Fulvimarina endophytica TaxID=2293836 RepID=A0A371X407_9HYPH|nr:two-component sensor histidine kinase [Fulvimarina endophytica]
MKSLALFAVVATGLASVFDPGIAIELALFCVFLIAILFWPVGRSEPRPVGAEAPVEREAFGAGSRAIVEALAEPVLVLDRETTLTYQNPASIEPLGRLAIGEAVALRFRAPHVLSAIDDAMRMDERRTAFLDERRGADRSFEIEILPVRDRDGGRPRIFLLVFSDRTAVRQTDRIRTDFVANASHELRTPLASLTGFIETLQGPARDDALARDRFLAIMRDQAARMSRLIDDLLSLSRIEMKRHLPVSEAVDLRAILTKVADQMAPLASDMGVAIETDLGPSGLEVAGASDELMQVFSNLVENACKYGRSGGRVVLRLRTGAERGHPVVDASVEDFGEGIAAEHVPRLTERFYRVDVGSSRAMQGTGLGLAIVRNILQRHKARLLIDSEPGRGTIFTTRFARLSGNAGEAQIKPEKSSV